MVSVGLKPKEGGRGKRKADTGHDGQDGVSPVSTELACKFEDLRLRIDC